MDNLTHSLAGALIGQAGLKRKTGLGMPALIIGANIPDIDAACFLWLDGIEHVGFRRGITHGPPAMLLLPLVLAGLLYGYDRWQAKRGKRPKARLPVRFGWLYVLSLIGCLSHPALDWMNVYGVRLLEPFSSQWFYGDVLFIIDIWLWLGMGLAVWFSLRRERRGGEWLKPARIALAGVGLYIAANGIVTAMAERDGTALMKHAYGVEPTLIVASPRPVLFWQRDILWRLEDPSVFGAIYGDGFYSPIVRTELFESWAYDRVGRPTVTWSNGAGDLKSSLQFYRIERPQLSQLIECNPDLGPFLFWSRMPVVLPYGSHGIEPGVFKDQRFMNPIGGDRFSVPFEPCEKAATN
jgi:inner membrane protein